MKKLLIILLTIIVLFGCEKEEEPENTKKLPELKEQFNLDDKYYNSTELKEVESTDINKLIDDKESFGVFVYSPGCSSCAAFSLVLTDFQKEFKIGFLKMSTAEMKKTIIKEYVQYAPTIVLFKEGKMVAYMDAVSDEEMPYFEDVKGFKTWLTKYINLEKELVM